MTFSRTPWRTALLKQHPWLTFVLPFLVYMVVGALEPTPDSPGSKAIGLAIPYSAYPWLYAAKIGLTVAAVLFLWPGYRQFPWRLTPLAIVVGVAGGLLWIGLCALDWEHAHLLPLLERWGLGGLIGAGERPAFNPFEQLAAQPAWAWTFLAVRFLGLVAVVPLVEEFFLRGFLMRVRDGTRLVECALRQGRQAGHFPGHGGADANAPGRIAGGGRVVFDDYLADAEDAQHLGLCGCPCRHQFDFGNLRGPFRHLAAHVGWDKQSAVPPNSAHVGWDKQSAVPPNSAHVGWDKQSAVPPNSVELI